VDIDLISRVKKPIRGDILLEDIKNTSQIGGAVLDTRQQALQLAEPMLAEIASCLKQAEAATDKYEFFYCNFIALERAIFSPKDKLVSCSEEVILAIAELMDGARKAAIYHLSQMGYIEMPIVPRRTRFDVDRHEVSSLQLSDLHAEGTIAEVVSPGWEFCNKVVKRASVKVYAMPRI
jgi:hypothetical protein